MHPYAAAEIVEYVANHNIKIVRCGIDKESHRCGDQPIRCCARGVVRHMYCPDTRMYSQEFLDKTNLSAIQAEGLEAGFEGNDFESDIHDSYYYEVGREVAKLVGY